MIGVHGMGSRQHSLRHIDAAALGLCALASLLWYVTTVRPLVEQMITLAKRDTLHSRRQAASFLKTPKSVKKLFDTLGARFGQRQGGYCRIVRLGPRKGDGAEQAMLELVGSELVKRAAERAKRREEKLKAIKEGREEEGGEEKS